MVEVRKYHLPPTDLIPNSPHPVLHYPGLLLSPDLLPETNPQHENQDQSDDDEAAPSPAPVPSPAPERVHDLFASNGWATQWIFRYGATQRSHYHTHTHEAMAVLSGTATIRLGVADAAADSDDPGEPGGVEVCARAGDVFVLPAGTAHKTYAPVPDAGFLLLTPGDGHVIRPEVVGGEGGVEDVDAARREALARVRLTGFTMIGAYPAGGSTWDFAVGGEKARDEYGEVWAVPKPARDPVLGQADDGICGQWK